MANNSASSIPSQPVVIEITIVSAQGLQNAAASFPIFWKRLETYATVAPSTRPCLCPLPKGRIKEVDKLDPLCTTRVVDQGGKDPQWNEKFRVPVETSFFADARSSICVRIYNRGFARRVSQLGLCEISALDILMSPPGIVGYLSYRLRNPRDGTRGHGIVNLAVKLDGLLENAGSSGFLVPCVPRTVITGFLVPMPRTVIGFPYLR